MWGFGACSRSYLRSFQFGGRLAEVSAGDLTYCVLVCVLVVCWGMLGSI